MRILSPNPSVLIVDDDEDDRWLLCEAFNQACPQVNPMFVKDGEEAISSLQVLPRPVFILTDLNMPRLNGVELVAQLKHHPFYRTIPVVICTTSSSDDDRQKCYLAGANAFVSKPHHLSDLVDLVHSLLTIWTRKFD